MALFPLQDQIIQSRSKVPIGKVKGLFSRKKSATKYEALFRKMPSAIFSNKLIPSGKSKSNFVVSKLSVQSKIIKTVTVKDQPSHSINLKQPKIILNECYIGRDQVNVQLKKQSSDLVILTTGNNAEPKVRRSKSDFKASKEILSEDKFSSLDCRRVAEPQENEIFLKTDSICTEQHNINVILAAENQFLQKRLEILEKKLNEYRRNNSGKNTSAEKLQMVMKIMENSMDCLTGLLLALDLKNQAPCRRKITRNK